MFLFVVALLIKPAMAGDDLLTPDGIAVGAALVANPFDNGASMVNPATAGLTDRYDIGAFVGAGTEFEVAGSVVDANTSSTALALAFRRITTNPAYTDDDLPGWVVDGELPPNFKRYTEFQGAVSYPFLDRDFVIGVGGTVATYDNDRDGTGWTGNVDVGLAGRAGEFVTMGLVGRNLLPFDSPRDTPTGVLAGVRLGDPRIGGIEVDGGAQFDGGITPDVRAGGEVVADIVRIRAGWNMTDQHAITGGLGFFNEAGGFSYGIRVPVGGGSPQHELGLVIYTKGVQ